MRKADATFAYAEQSIKQQLISKREYDQAKFDMQTQRAALRTAKLQLAYTRVKAPVSGVIAERSVKIGNLIQANQSLFRIVGMDPLQAVLNVPERQLGILKSGQPVQLEADALPGKKFAGDILRIAPVVDPASGTFRVTCEFHDKSGLLRPGMFGRIDIVYDHRDDALTIPRSALIQEDGETAVFVVDAAPIKVATNEARTRPKETRTRTRTRAPPTKALHGRCHDAGFRRPPQADQDRLQRRRQGGGPFRPRTGCARHHRRPQCGARRHGGAGARYDDGCCQGGRRQGVNIVEFATRRRVTIGMVTLTLVLFGAHCPVRPEGQPAARPVAIPP